MPSLVGAAAATTVALHEVASRVFSVVSANQEKSSELVGRFQRLSKNRTVLGSKYFGHQYVYSPVVDCLVDMYIHPNKGAAAGRTYVFYAEASSGKTTGGHYFFQKVLPELGARGIMISGANASYFIHMASKLGCKQDSPWVASLIAALMSSPLSNERPSLLLLDEFNDDGVGDMNIHFINGFMREIYDKGLYCVIMTQNLAMAKKLCNLNNWKKIAPLPSAHHGDIELFLEEPNWIPMKWTVSQLTDFIRARFPRSDFGGKPFCDWIREGMTPTDVLMAATNLMRKPMDDIDRFKDKFRLQISDSRRKPITTATAATTTGQRKPTTATAAKAATTKPPAKLVRKSTSLSTAETWSHISIKAEQIKVFR